jgi:ubiquinone/menaquinone biosynthesis C-methylase UbiE
LKVNEADRILQELWDQDVEAWDLHWVPIFRRFAHDLVIDAHISVGHAVLDVGTGTGVAAMEAVKRAKSNGIVIGIDRSVPMLELARRKYAKVKNVTFPLMNADRMTFPDGFFDVVISNCGMSYATFRETIAEIFRVLRKGGSFTFNDWHLIDVPAHRTFSEILRRHRTEHPSERLSRLRAAIAMTEHVGNQFSDLKVQAEELKRIGFTKMRIRQRDYKIRLSSVREYLRLRLEREALKQELNELSKVERAAFMKELKTRLRRFMHNGRFVMEWKVTFTHVTKGSR